MRAFTFVIYEACGNSLPFDMPSFFDATMIFRSICVEVVLLPGRHYCYSLFVTRPALLSLIVVQRKVLASALSWSRRLTSIHSLLDGRQRA